MASTAPISHLRAAKDFTGHTTAIENICPALIEILDRGHGAPCRATVLSEIHNLLHVLSRLSLHVRED